MHTVCQAWTPIHMHTVKGDRSCFYDSDSGGLASLYEEVDGGAGMVIKVNSIINCEL